MPIHVFRYKSVQGRLAPIITVGLKLHETGIRLRHTLTRGLPIRYCMLELLKEQGSTTVGHHTSVQVGDGVLSRCICMTWNSKLAQSDSWPGLGFPRD